MNRFLSLTPHAVQAGWLAAMRSSAEALQDLVQGATGDDASGKHSELAAMLGSSLARMAVLSRAGGDRESVQ